MANLGVHFIVGLVGVRNNRSFKGVERTFGIFGPLLGSMFLFGVLTKSFSLAWRMFALGVLSHPKAFLAAPPFGIWLDPSVEWFYFLSVEGGGS